MALRVWRSRLVRAVIASMFLLAVTACGSSSERTTSQGTTTVPTGGPEGDEFYVPPTPLPAGSDGDVIWSRPIVGIPGLPDAASNELVLYHSTALDGRDIAVSGMVATPKGDPPSGGWPVVSWAHGAVGYADVCAPSRDAGVGSAQHDYVALMGRSLNELVKEGYVVAQTDYEGLGTPGGHAYGVGQAKARSVADIVRAARQLDSDVGSRWIALGHSLGGAAVVVAAGSATDSAPELELLGAVDIEGSSRPLVAAALSGHIDVDIFDWPLLIAGAAAVDDSVEPERFLTPSALAAFRTVDSACLLDVVVAARAVRTSEITQPGADLAALLKVVKEQDFEAVQPVVPLLVVQGTPTPFSDNKVTALCNHGGTVQYSVYQGESHEGVVATALIEIQNWIHDRFAGQPAPSNCPM